MECRLLCSTPAEGMFCGWSISGASVVQNGATSMVGQCVIQLARLNDLQTINLIRDRPDLDSVKERLKALGADYVLTEEELGSLDKKTLAGRAQAKLGLNCVGGSAATAVMKLLGEGGVMVTYGGMAKKPITLSTGPLIFKDLRLQGFWLGKWKSNHSDEEFSTMVNYLLQLVRDGKLQYAYVSHYFCCIQFLPNCLDARVIWLSDI
jgi:trans-2-enoyl-CoA reductase